MCPLGLPGGLSAREGFIPVPNARLFYREIGHGQPIIVLHGGPDFDHAYLLPDMERLADSYRLIFYDQRGRGRSAGEVSPEDVTIESEIDDLDQVRRYFDLNAAALLGHSWGAVLAMEYAVHHPRHVSHLILMDPAPASYDDRLLLQEHRRNTAAADLERLKPISAAESYQAGDLQADAEYYRIHFRAAFRQPQHLDTLMKNLRSNCTPESIRKARAIEKRLYEQTWILSDYDLLPQLEALTTPALIIHGDHDLIPLESATHIAEAIPGARLAVVKDCGHFPYIEAPEEVHKLVDHFFTGV
jgi:proline iminopeptidase